MTDHAAHKQVDHPRRGMAWMMVWAVSFTAAMILNKKMQGVLALEWILWGRTVCALIIFAPFLQWQGLTDLWPLQVARGVLVTAAVLCSYTAYRMLPAHMAGILGALAPGMTLVAARLILGERIAWQRAGLVMLAFLGVIIVVFASPAETGAPLGLVHTLLFAGVSLVGSLCASGVIILARLLTQRGARTGNSLFFSTLIPLILFSLGLGVSTALRADICVPASCWWGWMGAIGLAGALSQFSYFKALSLSPVSLATPFEYVRLCLLIPAAYVFLGEVPDPTFYAGACLILVASALLRQMTPPG